MVKMVVLAAALGFSFNAMNAHGLPLIRKPLRETRHFATRSSLIQPAPKKLPEAKTQPSHESKSKTSITPQKAVAPENQYEPQKHKGITPKAGIVAIKPDEQPKKTAQALFTTLDDAKALLDSKSAIFIDARPKEDFLAEHITGAISLFVDDANSLYEKTLGKSPKDATIVTYCSDPECEDATKLADILVTKGHTRVVILLDGLPGWKDSGYPTEVEASSK